MKIKVRNKEKLSSAIEQVEARARVRCISVKDVEDAVKHIEKKLSAVLFKKDWVGLSFSVSPHCGQMPSSYKGTPEATKFKLERSASGWVVVDVSRGYMDGVYIRTSGMKTKADALVDFVCSNKYWN
ncbi:TPA: hypothetical protein ACKPYC_001450 [Pseudomonas aeruginosa]|jgi:hypothetical protein|uniref:hypothetical protein n=1 Tax=Pseudomonas aeruginosa TaxID=287 RepID=UPI000A8775C7|nr:hypothetical protein [Pseudomonas aeruginosa]KAB0769190.1 hypothetical protein F7O87_33570 [Pseudomonas aeruginosa]MBG6737908.1 hypothetical protein [Pseudomonas aeruginosa]MBH3789980.1 hypothetical protein [Pseudomonas aeruginosa]MBI7317288.1 hypothetical protein [Pseudomonas aeruginosa]MBI7329781.1 hypothetical protein [Pseudomonas aeruginosa]